MDLLLGPFLGAVIFYSLMKLTFILPFWTS